MKHTHHEEILAGLLILIPAVSYIRTKVRGKEKPHGS